MEDALTINMLKNAKENLNTPDCVWGIAVWDGHNDYMVIRNDYERPYFNWFLHEVMGRLWERKSWYFEIKGLELNLAPSSDDMKVKILFLTQADQDSFLTDFRESIANKNEL